MTLTRFTSLMSNKSWRFILLNRYFSTSLPDHTKIIMPKVSPTMTAGRLVTWKKHEGDSIEEGEDIADVESDKATMPIAARDDGFMARIFVQEDTPDIPLGRLLAIVVEEEEHVAAFKDYTPQDNNAENNKQQDSSSSMSNATNQQQQQQQMSSNTNVQSNNQKYQGPIGPAVYRLLNEYPNLNLDVISPTGPNGRLLKGDVLTAIESGIAFSEKPNEQQSTTTKTTTTTTTSTSTVTSTSETESTSRQRTKYTDIPVTSMRRAIAKRLNKTEIPHQYGSARYNLDGVSILRKQLNASLSSSPNAKISVNDIIIKAVATALRRVPTMNVHWDHMTNVMVQNDKVDISMAVAIEGGLITPIVKNADRLGIVDIAKLTKSLTEKARDGTLAPEEFEGGSFSISNLGMLGVSHFSAIINPPQSGILAVGAPLKMARLDDDGNMIKVTEGIATLSSDARAISSETAGQFLDEFTACMNDPESMIL